MITKPIQFTEAIRFLMDKEQLPAEWDSAMWQAQEPNFKTRAFWSAKVENARFIDRAQTLLFDHMAGVKEQAVSPDGVRSEALSVSDRSLFVEKMRAFMMAEGMAKKEDFKSINQKDVKDLRSMARLHLIFDTNVRQAYGFGQWKQGMRPDVLAAFPAARLIRTVGVREPRPRHQANIGAVMLKTDRRWAEFHNARDIGGFGVPWGPYGFNSGVTQEDVSRGEAESLGLPVSQIPEPPGFNEGLESSVKGMDPEIKRKLLEELRGGPKPTDPAEAGRQAAARAREQALTRGLKESIRRGDEEAAQNYRKAFSSLPNRGLRVVDRGDKILFADTETVRKALSEGLLTMEAAIEKLRGYGIPEEEITGILKNI